MYGGVGLYGDNGGMLWVYDGDSWGKLYLEDPEEDGDPDIMDGYGARHIMMTWDPDREGLVLLSYEMHNMAYPPDVLDVWLWTGQSWALAPEAADPTGDGHALPVADSQPAYDTLRHRLVVVGGALFNDQVADIWELDWGLDARPAAMHSLPAALAGMDLHRVESVSTAWETSAHGYVSLVQVDSAALSAWFAGAWQQIAESAVDTDESGLVVAAWDEPAEARRALGGPLSTLTVQSTPLHGNGPFSPAAVGVSYVEARIDYSIGTMHYDWAFNTESTQEWEVEGADGDARPHSGYWHLELTGESPGMESPKLEPGDAQPRFIHVRLRNSNPDCVIRFRFCPGYGGYYPEETSVQTAVESDGKWHAYRIDLLGSGAWQQEWHRFWFDLCLEPDGGEFDIDYIRMTD